jgi:membrane associated rhomboid family serine protease
VGRFAARLETSMSDSGADLAPPAREPFFKLPSVIILLLVLMIGVYAAIAVLSPALRQVAIERYALVPSHYMAGGHARYGVVGLLLPFVSHLFLHGNLTHLAFNALWLMAVGTPLARRLGPFPFLSFYFVCGVCSALAHLLTNAGSEIPVVGASGAISGCMAGALRVMFSPTARFYSKGLDLSGELASLNDRRILFVSVMWLLLNFGAGTGLLPLPGTGGAGIAWEAHIGGFFAGMLLIPIFDHAARRRDTFPGEAP